MFYKVIPNTGDNNTSEKILGLCELVHNNSECIGECEIDRSGDNDFFITESEESDSFFEALENIIGVISLLEDQNISEYGFQAAILEDSIDESEYKYAVIDCSDDKKTIRILDGELSPGEDIYDQIKIIEKNIAKQPEQDLEEYCKENDIEWIDEIDLTYLLDDEDGDSSDSTAPVMIFAPTDVIEKIVEMDFDDIENQNLDYVLEPIEMPYYLHTEYNEQGTHLRIYNRNSFPIAHELDGVCLADAQLNSDEGTISMNCSNSDVEEQICAFITVCNMFNKLIVKKGLESMIDSIDRSYEGILLKLSEDDDIEAEVVSGKERPDLAATTDLFMLNVGMARPYSGEMFDEFFDLDFDDDDDIDIDIDELAEKAENGDVNALDTLIDFFYEQDDFEEVFKWSEKFAEKNNAVGFYNLALCYANGRGCITDMKKAVELYEKAADMGVPQAMTNLAVLYINGDNVEQNEEKGFELFMKAAELDHGSAMRNLGWCYQMGLGTECDIEKAVEWYEKALEHFPDDRELNMKVMILKDSVEMDNKNDDVSCNRSDIDDIYCIMCESFYYADEDNLSCESALKNLNEAIDEGDDEAMFVLARYYFGNSNDADEHKRAVQLMKSAAEAGHKDAQMFIKANSELIY